jgi:hypothetical protein
MDGSHEYEGGRFSFGSGCEIGDVCSVIPILIIIVLLLCLLAGVLTGIAKNGLIKGIAESTLFAGLLLFSGFSGVVYLLVITFQELEKAYGKPYSFIPLALLFLLIYLFGRKEKKQVSQQQPISDTEDAEPPTIQHNISVDKTHKPVNYDIPTAWRKRKK